MTRIRAVVVLMLVPMAVLLWGSAPQVTRSGEPAPKIMLVLDVSGSMADPDPSGDAKMAAAKKALITSLDSMLPGPRLDCGSTVPRVGAQVVRVRTVRSPILFLYWTRRV